MLFIDFGIRGEYLRGELAGLPGSFIELNTYRRVF